MYSVVGHLYQLNKMRGHQINLEVKSQCPNWNRKVVKIRLNVPKIIVSAIMAVIWSFISISMNFR